MYWISTDCFGNAGTTATSKCKVRNCVNNTTARIDDECASYLKHNINKTTGCVDATSSCSRFQGYQAACSKFKGSSDKDYCWIITSTQATSNCAKIKYCDESGKNKKEFNNRMPQFKTIDNPYCIFYETLWQCFQ